MPEVEGTVPRVAKLRVPCPQGTIAELEQSDLVPVLSTYLTDTRTAVLVGEGR